MFGSAFSPRSDPSNIIKAINSVETKSSFLEEYKLKLDRIHQKREEARANQIAKQLTPHAKHPNPFKPGDLILRFDKSSKKPHGCLTGPYLVIDTPLPSTITFQNLITGYQGSASIKLCKPYYSDLPPNRELHKAVAAGDSEEYVISRVVSSRDTPSGLLFTVEWYGGETTEVPLDSIKNTKAYSLYRAKNKTPPLQSPPSKRAGSQREKRQC
ncbi:hypothetical protein RCL1_004900 [Eukaryota sp. TZLM3-RCL]